MAKKQWISSSAAILAMASLAPILMNACSDSGTSTDLTLPISETALLSSSDAAILSSSSTTDLLLSSADILNSSASELLSSETESSSSDWLSWLSSSSDEALSSSSEAIIYPESSAEMSSSAEIVLSSSSTEFALSSSESILLSSSSLEIPLSSSSEVLPSSSSEMPSSSSVATGTGSVGCGTATSFQDGQYTIVSEGTTRQYWIDLPDNYDSSHPYRLVIAYHWMDGNSSNVANGGSWASTNPYYGLKALSGDSVIYVAPEGLDNGWANTNDRDINFTLAMLDTFKQSLCIDTSRVFAVGFSYGGMMSNAIGCELGGTFRAVAPISSSLWSGCADSDKEVAAILTHGTNDGVVNIQYGQAARAIYLERNHCSSSDSVAIGSNGCYEYQNCDSDYPVVWCPWSGEHIPPSFSAQEIYDFFERF